ncbi:MAG: DUF1501 domain-containing protein [Rhodothermales bacterium]|nr:DUF1501 domain-containing protein [Rhodothermales bacterium]MBO6779983.1 DUF1501 domain-containing protein [Rhodothermales bacterium]
MCRNDNRHGARLEDGAAHTADHESWTRRQFLSGLGLASAGVMLHGGLPMRAMGQNSLLNALAGQAAGRTLVLIQLAGGNDGLNTIVPFREDEYHRQRPRLGLREADVIPVSADLGFHPALAPLSTRFADGNMAVIQGVGYPQPDLSHFRSTDIWVSASNSDVYDRTGWGGRALESLHPEYIGNLPSSPVGVQLGGASMMFRGRDANLGMTVSGAVQDLGDGGPTFDPLAVPATPYGLEMAFMREVANSSFRYSEAVAAALDGTPNRANYPDGEFSEQLAAVARMIRGGLGTRIYHVSLDGFDTHSEQENDHHVLLAQLAGGVEAFLTDLEAGGLDEDVLVMTFSEFGRTMRENGSRGTDHATVAPQFIFGSNLEGGFHGTAPDFTNLDDNGDLRYSVDFREVYATVLAGWFELPAWPEVLGGVFDRLGFLGSSVSAARGPELPGAVRIEALFPSPATSHVTIETQSDRLLAGRLAIYDVRGARVGLHPVTLRPGSNSATISVSRLAAGTYYARLEGSTARARPFTVVR